MFLKFDAAIYLMKMILETWKHSSSSMLHPKCGENTRPKQKLAQMASIVLQSCSKSTIWNEYQECIVTMFSREPISHWLTKVQSRWFPWGLYNSIRQSDSVTKNGATEPTAIFQLKIKMKNIFLVEEDPR